MGRPRGSRNKPRSDNGDGALHNTVSPDGLRRYIERVENVNMEIAELTSDRREIYAEIKAAGYDGATIRAIVRRRAMDADKRHAMDALMDEYMAALGDYAGTPLGQAGADRMRGEAGAG